MKMFGDTPFTWLEVFNVPVGIAKIDIFGNSLLFFQSLYHTSVKFLPYPTYTLTSLGKIGQIAPSPTSPHMAMTMV